MTTTTIDQVHAAPVTTFAARAIDAVKVYGEGDVAVRALDHVTLDIPTAVFTAVMGPSGCGKSTLVHCLAGLDTLTSGVIEVGGQRLAGMSENDLTILRRDRIGFVFQSFNLIPTLTAYENITLPADLARRQLDREWLDTVIDTVGLRDRLHHRPGELSGGQQQRVAVARSLAGRPDIVFADEPTGNLDSRAAGEILALLRGAVDDFDQTVVMVTHDAGAASTSDHVVFMADGRIADEMPQPTTARVLERMKTLGA
jgi:putative ABC transport system ATP-binding protein